MKAFLPFHEIGEQENVLIVDSMHAKGLTLSHWRGASPPDNCADDTSLGIVLNAIKNQIPELKWPNVSNNHFDVDGFLGVWSLFEPKLALQHESVLRQAALMGDFREYDPSLPGADHALKVVCWLNEIERREFYVPFGEKDEARACVPKYEYCLEAFGEVLQNPASGEAVWRNEYQRVKEDWAILASSASTQIYVEEIRLWINQTPEPLHYYALFGKSSDADMVLNMYQDNRYELEYKYTTWVDTATRNAYPRLHFEGLTQQLNAQELSSYQWNGDSIMDTGPILRLGGMNLTKAERFAHPYQRRIASSLIPPNVFKANVLSFYRNRYSNLQPQYRWSWAEMRAANENGF